MARKKRKIIVGNVASKLFNEQIAQLDSKYNKLWNAKKNEFRS